MVKKAYAPGQHGNKGQKRMTEYGIQLSVKQRFKNIYGIKESQLENYFKKVKGTDGDIGEKLLQALEIRLDNVVYRSGLAESRRQARQLVSHGCFLVNGRKVDVASFQVKPQDEIKLKGNQMKKESWVERLKKMGKKEQSCQWINVNPTEGSLKISHLPSRQEITENSNIQVVVAYYSR